MPKPLVSVIINTYNDSQYLSGAIQSALMQTYPNMQIVVYDNCSSDSTAEVLLGINDPRLHIVDAKFHTELSQARNLALENSEGELVCFLDSDDIWERGKVEAQVNVMMQGAIDFCFTNFAFSDRGVVGKPLFKKRDYNKLLHSLPLEISYPVALSTLMFRRDALGPSPFDQSTHITGDYRLVTRLARNCTWRMLTEPLAIIARRPDGESASKSRLMVEELVHYADNLMVQGETPASSFVRFRALEIGIQELRLDLYSSGLLRRIMSKPYFLWDAPSYTYYRMRQIMAMKR